MSLFVGVTPAEWWSNHVTARRTAANGRGDAHGRDAQAKASTVFIVGSVPVPRVVGSAEVTSAGMVVSAPVLRVVVPAEATSDGDVSVRRW